ncbi:MAG: SDR family oxidoreductase [Chloroflexota bacterium]|nr:SDR family oxidoreductase [Chloroflexota bacterium]
MTGETATDAGRLNGQVAIVTGAAQGLGLGIATRLAADGATIVLADISDALQPAAAAIGSGATARLCDVADPAAVDRLVAATVAQHGRLDVMVANAGIGGGAPLVEMTDEAFRRIVGVNLEGCFYCCRAAARVMIPRQSGTIITVGSIFGRDTPAGSAAYGAAKAGVVALTQAAARELGPYGIRVNCVSPGQMATEMHWAALRRRADATGQTFEQVREAVWASVPLGRHGTAAEIGAVVAFLVSPDAAYVTGQTINVDGGFQPR